MGHPPDPQQRDAVKDAFTSAFNVVGMVGLATMLGVLALVVTSGRRRARPEQRVTAYSAG